MATTMALSYVLPVVRFAADTETGLVHCIDQSCDVFAGEVFLDVRTALVRGYQLCSKCQWPAPSSFTPSLSAATHAAY